MRRRKQRKQADANADMMVGGIGLAAMQSMFNMVNTQSSLSTSMARSFELSLPIQMQALAGALAQILMAQECGCCGGGNRSVPVNIPSGFNTPPSGGDTGHELGAIGSMSDLNSLLNKNKGDANTTTTNSAMDAAIMQSIINAQTQQLHDQMVDISGANNQKLAVT